MISLSILVLAFVMLLLIMFIIGIVLWFKKHRVAGSVVSGIPIIIVGGSIGALYWLFHSSMPQSLELSVVPSQTTAGSYTLHGEWDDRPDHYSFGTDFVVFYTPNNQPVVVTKWNKGDWKPNWYNFDQDIPIETAKNPFTPKEQKPQLVDIKLQDEFAISFSLPMGVSLDQVTIQYVHVVEEPMDAMTYWVKTYGKE